MIAVVMLHAGCDMYCNFCITEPLACIGYERAAGLLGELALAGFDNVVIGGGEPFAWPHDVAALARVAHSLGFFVQIGTNGIRLPEGFERLEAIDRYVLPLESARPAVHDQMRVYLKSHHAIILDRLESLRKAGKSATVSTVVTRWNLDGLPALGRWLAEYRRRGGNLHAWHLYRFVPEGRGGRLHAALLSVDEPEYHDACDRVRRMDLGFTIYKRPDMYKSRSVRFLGAGARPHVRETGNRRQETGVVVC